MVPVLIRLAMTFYCSSFKKTMENSKRRQGRGQGCYRAVSGEMLGVEGRLEWRCGLKGSNKTDNLSEVTCERADGC